MESEARAHATPSGPEPDARALIGVGARELQAGNRAAAEDALERAVARLGTAEGAERIRAEAYLLRSRCAFIGQRMEDALRHGQEALALAAAAEDPDLRSRAANGLGIVYGAMGAYTRALELLLETVRLREEHGLDPLGGPFNNMGNIFLLQDDPPQALDSFERALAAYRDAGSRQDEIIALGNVGRAFEALEQPHRARRVHEEAVRIAREHGVGEYEAPALTKLGSAQLASGDVAGALATLEEALRLADARAGTFREEALRGLAEARLRAGDVAGAEACARDVMALAVEHDHSQVEQAAHRLLARILEGAERWREALEHQKRYHDLRLRHDRELFSSRTRALQLEHEDERARREQVLLRARNRELSSAYEELQDLHDALRTQAEELERLTLEDPLTGLHNRRSLERRAQEEVARIARYGGTFSVLVMDIDDFKATNDRFSHAVGDDVLAAVAALLRGSTRGVDVAARFGGEEFVVLLPETPAAAAAGVAEKIRRGIERHAWSDLRPELRVTVSVGVAEALPGAAFDAVFAEADAQLYRAKRAGKNRVVRAASEPSTP